LEGVLNLNQGDGHISLGQFFVMLKELHPFYSNEELIQKDKYTFSRIENLRQQGSNKELREHGLFDNSIDLFEAGMLVFPENGHTYQLLNYVFRKPEELIWNSSYAELIDLAPTFNDMPNLRKNTFRFIRFLHKQIWARGKVDFMAAIEDSDLTKKQILAILEYENIFASMNEGQHPKGSMHDAIERTISLKTKIDTGISQQIMEILQKVPGIDTWYPDEEIKTNWNQDHDVDWIYRKISDHDTMILNESVSMFLSLSKDAQHIRDELLQDLKDAILDVFDKSVTLENSDALDGWTKISEHFYVYGDCERVRFNGKEVALAKKQSALLMALVNAYKNGKSVVSREALLLAKGIEHQNKTFHPNDNFDGHLLKPYIKYDRSKKGYFLAID
jgi:hypothetical protein